MTASEKDDITVDYLAKSLNELRLDKTNGNSSSLKKGKLVVSCKNFPHAHVGRVTEKSPSLLTDCEEVHNCSYVVGDSKMWDATSNKPKLKPEVCDYIKSSNWKSPAIRDSFVGFDLTKGYDEYVPLPRDILNSVDILTEAYERYEKALNKDKTTFISLRHHLIDIIMCPFQNEPVSLIMTVLPDKNILISVDKSKSKPNGIHDVANPHARKICYTGFALEDLLTEPTNSSGVSDHELFYSIVRGSVDNDIDLFFQAEIDSINTTTDTYTEIKSSVHFRMSNTYHRRKLLRMWIQTTLLPKSDLLIGFRNCYSNELEQLKAYKIQDIYNKVSNRSLVNKPGKFYRFNPNIANDWFHYIFKVIRIHLLSMSQETPSKSFKVLIDANLTLSIQPISPST
ncbi:unnamed protein product [Kluyveromyces dobzhanskii CBS 2104]|uniref:Decapping nuclease n=1 Tax=Kluyveromyces dobzhanskii CBS 2104 TaxID=1427455 RepID=A0A0A8L569_9SACH|nr:unnamed protein product [Kluyveromyces dobzhanskii CBS 2104]